MREEGGRKRVEGRVEEVRERRRFVGKMDIQAPHSMTEQVLQKVRIVYENTWLEK